MVKIIIKYIIYILNIPCYCISVLTPNKKNLWIFGAWFGQRYSDNSKYLFEYINNNNPKIRAIWLARNKDVVKIIRAQGYESYLAYSPKGYLLSMRAEFAIVSHSKSADLNKLAISSQTKIIQLYHGIPLKKIEYDDKIFAYRKEENFFVHILKILRNYIFPFLIEHYDMMIATSLETKRIFSHAFRLNQDKINITGYPRNDILLKKNTLDHDKKRKEKKSGIYMPTFRGDVGDSPNYYLKYGFNIKTINEFLKERNICLHFKLHPVNNHCIEFSREFDYVKLLKIDDIYSILQNIDFLVTDYSSIYFDFLLLDKPIIFAPFDKEDYIKNDRELYYNYEDVTPGPKAKNWSELLGCIEEAVNYPEKYSHQRQEIRNQFHKYIDGNSSKRVYEAIHNMIN